MSLSLRARADALPSEPGVYLFKDKRGRVLYVGKAKNVRARVRQYITGQDERLFVPYLVRTSADVDAVVVQTEKEALILENTLIKKHRPRYNVKLVDDSSFLHLQIDTGARWPRYRLVRSVDTDRARLRSFGPFTSASRGRATLEFLSRRFPLRTCSDRELRSRSRPCLLHQMGRCIAPCADLCTKEEYDEVVAESLLFVSGRNTELLARLRRSMAAAAEELDFEKAARQRDLIRAIESSIERQSVVDRKLGNRDVWGLSQDEDGGVVALLPVRQGMMHEAALFPFTDGPWAGAPGELLSSVLNAWYGRGADIPAEVLLPQELPDHEAMAEVLSERRGSTVRLLLPQRGAKARLIETARENALAERSRRRDAATRQQEALAELQRVCQLPRPPRRMECFDNSNVQGTDPVAAMVVYVDGQRARQHDRRYRIKTVVGSDDYASMAEVLGRRLRRGVEEGELPDLLVVDGGKGQLNVALAVLRELGFRHQREPASDRPLIGVIGIAKPRTERARGDREAVDKLVLPGAKNLIRLPANSAGLRLVQSLRDATHDAAVSYHRKRRRKRTLTGSLDGLPGVGPARKRSLLAHFGSIAAVRAASVEQLAEVPGLGLRSAAQLHAAMRDE